MSQPRGELEPAAAETPPAAARPTVQIHATPESASLAVAHEIADLVRARAAQGRRLVLGLATGSTPLRVYRELVRLHRDAGLSMSHVVTFNLDEYWPIDHSAPGSFHAFMQRHLFDHVDIPPASIHIPSGRTPAAGLEAACAAYEQAIRDAGGIDLQLLGIGRSGHIGFNEPPSSRASRTRLVDLHPVTLEDMDAAAGDGAAGQGAMRPRRAVTMGVATVLEARQIVLLAFGKAKAEIIGQAVEGAVGPQLPASFLRDHPRCRFVLDREAAARLT